MDNANNAPEKLVINGQEYDPSEAANLIDIGNKTREFESKWNTSLDKVYPDYTRATQKAARADQLEQELTALKEKAALDQRNAETPTEKRQALQAARELGLADQDYLKEQGYITKNELDSYYQAKSREQQATQELIETGKKFASEIDGSDGRARYNDKAVLAYATQYGFFKDGKGYNDALMEAYNDMNADTNASWKKEQLDAARKPGLTTLKGRGMKVGPEEKKVTSENFGDMLKESLWGSEE